MGFPIPYWPYGRWGIPMPRRTPVTVAVGAPVHPLKKNPEPTIEEIVELQTRYFAALEELFFLFRDEADHADYTITWMD
jgi:hypothetical protein